MDNPAPVGPADALSRLYDLLTANDPEAPVLDGAPTAADFKMALSRLLDGRSDGPATPSTALDDVFMKIAGSQDDVEVFAEGLAGYLDGVRADGLTVAERDRVQALFTEDRLSLLSGSQARVPDAAVRARLQTHANGVDAAGLWRTLTHGYGFVLPLAEGAVPTAAQFEAALYQIAHGGQADAGRLRPYIEGVAVGAETVRLDGLDLERLLRDRVFGLEDVIGRIGDGAGDLSAQRLVEIAVPSELDLLNGDAAVAVLAEHPQTRQAVIEAALARLGALDGGEGEVRQLADVLRPYEDTVRALGAGETLGPAAQQAWDRLLRFETARAAERPSGGAGPEVGLFEDLAGHRASYSRFVYGERRASELGALTDAQAEAALKAFTDAVFSGGDVRAALTSLTEHVGPDGLTLERLTRELTLIGRSQTVAERQSLRGLLRQTAYGEGTLYGALTTGQAVPTGVQDGLVGVLSGFGAGGGGGLSRPQVDGAGPNWLRTDGVSFDAEDGTFAVGESSIPLADLGAAAAWRPGEALAGYRVEETAYGIYRYTREGATAGGSLPDSFSITYAGQPWPPFVERPADYRAETRTVRVNVDGNAVAFDLPRANLRYDARSGIATYDTPYDGIKFKLNLRDFVVRGRPAAIDPAAVVRDAFWGFETLASTQSGQNQLEEVNRPELRFGIDQFPQPGRLVAVQQSTETPSLRNLLGGDRVSAIVLLSYPRAGNINRTGEYRSSKILSRSRINGRDVVINANLGVLQLGYEYYNYGRFESGQLHSVLTHELSHVFDAITGYTNSVLRHYSRNQLSRDFGEPQAVQRENRYRAELGVPQRALYGQNDIHPLVPLDGELLLLDSQFNRISHRRVYDTLLRNRAVRQLNEVLERNGYRSLAFNVYDESGYTLDGPQSNSISHFDRFIGLIENSLGLRRTPFADKALIEGLVLRARMAEAALRVADTPESLAARETRPTLPNGAEIEQQARALRDTYVRLLGDPAGGRGGRGLGRIEATTIAFALRDRIAGGDAAGAARWVQEALGRARAENSSAGELFVHDLLSSVVKAYAAVNGAGDQAGRARADLFASFLDPAAIGSVEGAFASRQQRYRDVGQPDIVGDLQKIRQLAQTRVDRVKLALNTLEGGQPGALDSARPVTPDEVRRVLQGLIGDSSVPIAEARARITAAVAGLNRTGAKAGAVATFMEGVAGYLDDARSGRLSGTEQERVTALFTADWVHGAARSAGLRHGDQGVVGQLEAYRGWHARLSRPTAVVDVLRSGLSYFDGEPVPTSVDELVRTLGRIETQNGFGLVGERIAQVVGTIRAKQARRPAGAAFEPLEVGFAEAVADYYLILGKRRGTGANDQLRLRNHARLEDITYLRNTVSGGPDSVIGRKLDSLYRGLGGGAPDAVAPPPEEPVSPPGGEPGTAEPTTPEEPGTGGTEDVLPPKLDTVLESAQAPELVRRAVQSMVEPLQSQIAVSNDHAQIVKGLLDYRQDHSDETGTEFVIDTDSVRVADDHVTFSLQPREGGEASTHRIALADLSLQTPTLLDRLQNGLHKVQEFRKKRVLSDQERSGIGEVTAAAGFYLAGIGLLQAIGQIENGNHDWESIYGITTGTYFAAESGFGGLSRSVGGLLKTQFGAAIKSVVSRAGTVAAEGVAKVTGRTVEDVTTAFSSLTDAGSSLARTLGKLAPAVGLAVGAIAIGLDGKAIADAVRNHDAIGIAQGVTDAIVDIGVEVLQVVGLALGPEAEAIIAPVTLVLTVVRMVLDSVFGDIRKELAALPDNATDWEKFVAVSKGAVEGVEDFVLEATGISALLDTAKLERKHAADVAKLQSYNNPHTYFGIHPVDGVTGEKEIDFTQGDNAFVTGNLTFRLGEPGQASTLSVGEVPVTQLAGGDGWLASHTVHWSERLPSHTDTVVLGIGESNKVQTTQETANLFWAIPVHHETLIAGYQADPTSLRGTYIGNSLGDTFVGLSEDAVQDAPGASQEVKDSNYQTRLRIRNYRYTLHGLGGDDTFILGTSHYQVHGGDGADTYVIKDDNWAFASRLPRITRVLHTASSDDALDTVFIEANLDDIYLSHGVATQTLVHRTPTITEPRLDFAGSSLGIHVYTDRLPVYSNFTHQGADVEVKDFFASTDNQNVQIRTQDGYIVDPSVQRTRQASIDLRGYGGSASVIDSAKPLLDRLRIGADEVVGFVAPDDTDLVFDAKSAEQAGRRLRTIVGRGGDDVISGNGLSNQILGGAGADRLFGRGGDDVLNAGIDNKDDVLNGGRGDDTLIGGLGFDSLVNGRGADTFVVLPYDLAPNQAQRKNYALIKAGKDDGGARDSLRLPISSADLNVTIKTAADGTTTARFRDRSINRLRAEVEDWHVAESRNLAVHTSDGRVYLFDETGARTLIGFDGVSQHAQYRGRAGTGFGNQGGASSQPLASQAIGPTAGERAGDGAAGLRGFVATVTNGILPPAGTYFGGRAADFLTSFRDRSPFDADDLSIYRQRAFFTATKVDYRNTVPSLGARASGGRDGGINGFLGVDDPGTVHSRDGDIVIVYLNGYVRIEDDGHYQFDFAHAAGDAALAIDGQPADPFFSGTNTADNFLKAGLHEVSVAYLFVDGTLPLNSYDQTLGLQFKRVGAPDFTYQTVGTATAFATQDAALQSWFSAATLSGGQQRRSSGYIHLAEAGSYHFRVAHTGHFELRIDGETVVASGRDTLRWERFETDGGGAYLPYANVAIDLGEGVHHVELVYQKDSVGRAPEIAFAPQGVDDLTVLDASNVFGAIEDLPDHATLFVPDDGGAPGVRFSALSLDAGQVVNLTGTANDDRLTGNAQDNVFAPLGGHDHVTGAGGRDIYQLDAASSGLLTIDNIDPARADDTLLINVTRTAVTTRLSGQDLHILVNRSHRVTVRNWAVSQDYRHLRIQTLTDGFTLRPTADGQGVEALSVSYGNAETGVRFDLPRAGAAIPELATIEQITGSPGDDVLVGNALDNTIAGNGGADRVTGGGGRDVYRLDAASTGLLTLNNEDGGATVDDVLVLDVDVSALSVSLSGDDLHIAIGGVHRVTVENWAVSDIYRHLQIRTQADPQAGQFAQLSRPRADGSGLDLIGVDASDFQSGLTLDASDPSAAPTFEQVFGGPGDDRFTGNALDNLLVGGAGDDTLSGGAGKDVLVAGAGNDTLSGGDGADIYVVGETSNPASDPNTTLILNEATDTAIDTVRLHTDFAGLGVSRDGDDLKITKQQVAGASSALLVDITVRDGRAKGFSDHLLFATDDGYLFAVTEGAEPQIVLRNVDHSRADAGVTLDGLTDPALRPVGHFTGSSFADVITGNAGDNLLVGGKGNDRLTGGSGHDVYSFSAGDGDDTIDNTDAGSASDTLLFDFAAAHVTGARKDGADVVVETDLGVSVRLLHWLTRDDARHLSVKTTDLIYRLDASGVLRPISIDLSASTGGQTVDASTTASYEDVAAITGSAFDDRLTGNAGDNSLDGGAGRDRLAGGDGRDVYIVGESGLTTIDNTATDGAVDRVRIAADADRITLVRADNDLYLVTGTLPDGGGSNADGSYATAAFQALVSDRLAVRVLDWFVGETKRHLVVETEGGQVYEIDDTDLTLTALELDYSSQTGVTVDLGATEVKSVTDSSGNDTIVANALDNVIVSQAGDDILTGGDGNDVYRIAAGDGADRQVIVDLTGSGTKSLLLDVTADQLFWSRRDETRLTLRGENLILHIDAAFSSLGSPDLAIVTADGFSYGVGDDGALVVRGADFSASEAPRSFDALDQTADTARRAQALAAALDVPAASTTAGDKRPVPLAAPQATRLVGTAHGEQLSGNAAANEIHAQGGNDVLRGGDGGDTYILQANSHTVIDNQASDGATDTVVLPADYTALGFHRIGQDLFLVDRSTDFSLTVSNWYLGEDYRHLTLATPDGYALNVKADAGLPDAPSDLTASVYKRSDAAGAAETDLFVLFGRLIAGNADPAATFKPGAVDYELSEQEKLGGNLLHQFLGDDGAQIDPSLTLDGAAVHITGAWYAEEAGVYDFDLASDGGAVLLVDGSPVAEINENAGAPLRNLTLTQGRHTLELYYIPAGGTAVPHLQLSYRVDQGDTRVFDNSDLRHKLAPVETVEIHGLDRSRSADGQTIDMTAAPYTALASFQGGSGDDRVTGNDLDNRIRVGAGDDAVTGGKGQDVLYGDGGDDTLRGGADNDALWGGIGADVIDGGAGHDVIVGGVGADAIDGGAGDGIDTVLFAGDVNTLAGVTVDLSTGTGAGADAQGDTYANIENVYGTAYDDVLTGNGVANLIDGGDGDDTISGLGGNDTISGGGGDNRLDGGEGTDLLSYAGSASGVELDWAAGRVTHGRFGDRVDTIANFETVEGSAFNDTITGDGADNLIIGSLGADIIDGGGGTDTLSYEHLVFQNEADTGGLQATGVWVDLGAPGFDYRAVDDGYVSHSLTNIENVTGSLYDDALTGDAGANVLNGGDGHDTLRGGTGNDSLRGGKGDDLYLFGRGDGQDDIVNDDGGSDTLRFDTGIDHDQLFFERSGMDLVIEIIGTDDQVTIAKWFDETQDRRIDRIEAGDGTAITDRNVAVLVEAMATFAPLPAGVTRLPDDTKTALATQLALFTPSTGGA